MSLAGNRPRAGRQLLQPLGEGMYPSPGNGRLGLRTRPCGGQGAWSMHAHCGGRGSAAPSCWHLGPALVSWDCGSGALDPVPDLTGALWSPSLSKPQCSCLRSAVDSHPVTVLWDVVKPSGMKEFCTSGHFQGGQGSHSSLLAPTPWWWVLCEVAGGMTEDWQGTCLSKKTVCSIKALVPE